MSKWSQWQQKKEKLSKLKDDEIILRANLMYAKANYEKQIRIYNSHQQKINRAQDSLLPGENTMSAIEELHHGFLLWLDSDQVTKRGQLYYPKGLTPKEGFRPDELFKYYQTIYK